MKLVTVSVSGTRLKMAARRMHTWGSSDFRFIGFYGRSLPWQRMSSQKFIPLRKLHRSRLEETLYRSDPHVVHVFNCLDRTMLLIGNSRRTLGESTSGDFSDLRSIDFNIRSCFFSPTNVFPKLYPSGKAH
ncbi:hypothetical protein J6590_035531 [Homalodisca vitripennis]|nr:hypothetical protein J6590_035531 [Homalodisca vitripennis]